VIAPFRRTCKISRIRQTARMIKICITASIVAIALAGCSSAPSRPAGEFVAAPGQARVATAAGPVKRISREGSQLALPDGTRVTPDSTGGFVLPNGARVDRDRSGALVLPTGARCTPDAGGYVCP
jgi:hypothetical protein